MKHLNFFKILLPVLLLSAFATSAQARQYPDTLRVLYWNIQNGMWADQHNNYDNFVEWVRKYDPDVCIWAEAKSRYVSHQNVKMKEEDHYLIKGWGELAARYGHAYWEHGGHRDGFPQVVTSKYPIEVVSRIVGEEPDQVVTHGAGHFLLKIAGRKINIVTLHTWPQKFGYAAKDRKADAARNGGDAYRLMEMKYICSHTISQDKKADKHLWLMAGDFNARSIKDQEIYGWPDDDSRYWVHNYILEHTPYLDVIKERYPDQFHETVSWPSRIDFVYCTPALYKMITDAYVVRDEWTGDIVKHPKFAFKYPSDHRPILVDIRLR